MKKDAFVDAVKKRNTILLSAFLLNQSPAYVELFSDFTSQEEAKTWVGNILYLQCKKKKMSEENLMYVFSLKDEKGNMWIDYIIKQEQKIGLGLIELWGALYNQNLLSSKNLLELLFSSSSDGWTYLCCLARYQFSCHQSLISLFKSLIKRDQIVDDLKHHFQKTTKHNWSFLHYLTYFQEDEVILNYCEFFEYLLKKNLLKSEDVLNFLSLRTNANETPLFFLMIKKRDKGLSGLIKLLRFVYEKSSTTLNSIFNIFESMKVFDPKILIDFLENEAFSSSQTEFSKFIELIYQTDINNLSKIIMLLTDSTDENVNLFCSLTKGIVGSFLNQFHVLIIKMISDFIHRKKCSNRIEEIPIDSIIKMFLKENDQQWNYLSSVAFSVEDSEIIECLAAILKYFLERNRIGDNETDCKKIEDEDKRRIILMGKTHDWTFPNLLARYQGEKCNIKFLEIILQNSESNFSKSFLKNLLTSEEKLPFYMHLLYKYQSLSCVRKILEDMKSIVVKDKELVTLLLSAIHSCNYFFVNDDNSKVANSNNQVDEKTNKIENDKKEAKENYVKWLQNYIKDLLENRLFFEVENLTLDDKKYLEYFSEKGISAASFLLYKYYFRDNDKDKSVHFLEIACGNKYDFAILEKSIKILKKISIKSNPIKLITSLLNLPKSEDFVKWLKKKRRYLNPDDVILLLNNSLSVFKDDPIIFFQIAGVHREHHPEQSKVFFDKIRLDTPTLSWGSHNEVCYFYFSLYEQSKQIIMLYFSVKHYQLSCEQLKLKLNKLNSGNSPKDTNSNKSTNSTTLFRFASYQEAEEYYSNLQQGLKSCLDQSIDDCLLLKYLLELQIKKESFPPKIRSCLLKLESFILNFLQKANDSANNSLIINSQMCLKWLLYPSMTQMEKEYTDYLQTNKNANQKSSELLNTLHSIFSIEPEITAIIHELYFLIRNNMIKDSNSRISQSVH